MLGAGLVIGVDGVTKRLEMAKHLGADVVIDNTSLNVVEEIQRLTHGRGVDSAIKCMGAQATFEAFVKATRPGGTIAGDFGHGDSVEIPRIE